MDERATATLGQPAPGLVNGSGEDSISVRIPGGTGMTPEKAMRLMQLLEEAYNDAGEEGDIQATEDMNMVMGWVQMQYGIEQLAPPDPPAHWGVYGVKKWRRKTKQVDVSYHSRLDEVVAVVVFDTGVEQRFYHYVSRASMARLVAIANRLVPEVHATVTGWRMWVR